MNKLLTSIFMSLSLIFLSCGGNSGNYSTGGVYFTHSELAQDFVYRMYVDLGINLDLEKTYTLQNDYIVVYDYWYGEYVAYYLGAYNPGENIQSYINQYNHRFYYDLDYLGLNRWKDWWSGRTFETTEISNKDLEKVGAFMEQLKASKVADALVAEYGLSEERGKQLGKLVVGYEAQSSKRQMTPTEINSFAQDFLGTKVENILSAVETAHKGDRGQYERLLDQAIEKNEATDPEGLKEFINSVFAL